MTETHYLDRPGGRIAYDDTGGDGQLVIMVPGIGDLRQEYRFAVPRFEAAGYRVVTADLRGHGESSVNWPEYTVAAVADDILGLVDHLGSDGAGPGAHVIGTSFAAAAAVYAAAEGPDRLDSIVLVGPFVRDVPLGPLKSVAAAVVMNGPWRVWAWDKYYGSLYRTRQPDDLDAYRAQLRANLSEPGRFEANKALAEATKEPAETRLAQVSVPALVVMGTKDPDFPDPQAEARWIADRLNGDVAMIEGAGHYPQAEIPDAFAEAVLPFLSSGVTS